MNPFKETIFALENYKVSYIAVGGFAAVMHGCNRFTADLDIIIDFSEQNVVNLTEAMNSIGFTPRLPIKPKELSDEIKRKEWLNRNMQVFTFLKTNNPLFLLDVFIYHPLDFEILIKNSEYLSFEGGSVRICDIDSLIQLKKLANRPKDIEDINELTFILSKK